MDVGRHDFMDNIFVIIRKKKVKLEPFIFLQTIIIIGLLFLF